MRYSATQFLNGHRVSLATNLLLLSVLCLGCDEPKPLTVDMPLHLEEHLEAVGPPRDAVCTHNGL